MTHDDKDHKDLFHRIIKVGVFEVIGENIVR
jgi:cyclopropane fatty-acyl-phospholipid synthase-like methyltransferase